MFIIHSYTYYYLFYCMRLYPKQYKYSFVYFVLHRNGMTPWVIFCLFAQYFVWQSVHCAMWSSNYIFFTAVLYSITWAYCLCLFIPMAANGHKVAAYYILSFHVLSLFIFTLTLSGRYFDNPHHPNENTFDLEQPGNFPKVVSEWWYWNLNPQPFHGGICIYNHFAIIWYIALY